MIEILNGRWGPYIKVGKENHRIPKGTDVESLDREACEALIAKGPKSKK